jgi:radical SAM protein with 4Fe4S-binding SPASM domain
LSLDDLVYLFDQVQAMGIDAVRISGGEPTLHPDFPSIIRAAVSRGLRVSLNTNGLYAPHTRQQIAGLDIALFLVSLDGLCSANDRVRGAGVFDRVVATVRWLRSLGRIVLLGTHLNRGNLADVEGLIALAAELGADIKFAPLRLVGRARELMADEAPTPADFYTAVQSITRLRSAYPRTRIYTDFDILQPATGASQTLSPSRASCPAGRSMLNVSYEGYVYPCAFLATPQREFAAGHLRQASLLRLWRESPVFHPFRTLEKDARCRSCFAYGRACVGGCVALSYFVAGRLDARDPTCFVGHILPPEAIRG